jgi:hypothetical protein
MRLLICRRHGPRRPSQPTMIPALVTLQSTVKIVMIITAHAPDMSQIELHAILILVKEQSIARFLTDV